MSHLQRASRTVWHYVTIVLGGAPALFLCIPAGLAVVYGVHFVVSGFASANFGIAVLGVLIAVWGVLGIYGTMALWTIGLGHYRNWVETGLLLGTAAILPVTWTVLVSGLAPESLGPVWVWVLVVTLPPIIAIGWVIEFYRRPSLRKDGREDSRARRDAAGTAQ